MTFFGKKALPALMLEVFFYIFSGKIFNMVKSSVLG